MTPCRFEINFLSEAGDIAFHVKPRFSSATMVGNTFQGGRWGQEEVSSVFPLVLGEPFEVTGAAEGMPRGAGLGYYEGTGAIPQLCGKGAVSPHTVDGVLLWVQVGAPLRGGKGMSVWLRLRAPIWGGPA